MRIIVGNEEDTPDWMVSDTSGAASRRTGQKKPEPETPERVVRGDGRARGCGDEDG